MSFWAIAVMRFLSRSMIFCSLPAIGSSFYSADFEYQLALQVAPLADAVRLGGVGELIAGDGRRRHRAGIEQCQHAFQMGAVTRNSRAEHLNILAGRLKPRRR